MILAADVGATKILVEAGDFRSGLWEPQLARRYLIAEHDGFAAVMDAFLEDLEREAAIPKRRKTTLEAAAIGAAGFVQGNKVRMTHRAWVVDGDAVARRFRIARGVRVMNDLAAAAHGVDALAGRDLMTIQPGRALPEEPRVVMGVGTGLGVAYIIPGGQGSRVIPGEGGHVGFSPASADQAALWQALFEVHGRVEAEHVCSGMGLSNIYEVLVRPKGRAAPARPQADGAWIAEQAAAGDAMALKALDLFAECLGNVAGDHAIATMARGGVFLAGGVVAKLAPRLNVERLRAAFCAKGLFSSQLMRIPVKLVKNERVAIVGAARIANELRATSN